MKISFTGLNENIMMGRFAVRQVRQDYPRGFLSNTRYEAFSNKVNPKMDRFLREKIRDTREKVSFQERLGYDGLTAVERVVKQTGAANCGEQAYLLSKQLKKDGVNHKIVIMEMNKDKSFVDSHTFCVIGLDDKAVINKPETWGEEAVVADLWLNSVDKANKALSKFLKIMDFSKKENTVRYHEPYVI